MFLVGLLSWWYGNGLYSRFQIVNNRLRTSADFFSVGLLLRTLFSPYKQISAGNVDGPIGVRFHAFFDRLISRVIGAIVRSSVVVLGLIVMFLQVVFGVVTLLAWLAVPLLPAAGLILWTIGWVPK